MLLLLCFSSSFLGNVFADSFESNEHLFSVAKEYIEQVISPEEKPNVKISSEQNNAFQLAICQQPIQASLPPSANEQISSVELRCPDAGSWHIYYPVNVEYFEKVVVAKHLLSAKQSITEGDIDIVSINKNQLYQGYFTDYVNVLGKETSHIIPAGTVLTKVNIKSPLIVKRDQIVMITVKSKSVMVSMQGVAKSDGGLNDMIKVYNPSSKKMLDAVITGPGVAEINIM